MTTLNTNIEQETERVAYGKIANFFEAGSPKEHRKDLKKWRFHVINDSPFKNRHGAGYVLALHDETIDLIGAAYLLLKNSEWLLKEPPVTEKQLQIERLQWEYYPTNLSKKELVSPCETIKKFFKKTTIEQYNECLKEWLRIALSNKGILETLTAKEIIDTYDNIRRLYSAAWLIYQRGKCK